MFFFKSTLQTRFVSRGTQILLVFAATLFTMAPADNVPPSFLDEMTKQFITKTDKSTEWTYNFPPIEDPDKE